MLVSIDPGLHTCGVAAWGPAGELRWAGLVKNPSLATHSMVHAVDETVKSNCGGFRADRLAIELPQVYVRSRSKGDPNDLISLARLVGAFEYFFDGRFGSTIYKPAQWKGQTPKDVTEARAKKRLTEAEITRIVLPPAKSLRHNVWDGIGLGLHHLNRHE